MEAPEFEDFVLEQPGLGPDCDLDNRRPSDFNEEVLPDLSEEVLLTILR